MSAAVVTEILPPRRLVHDLETVSAWDDAPEDVRAALLERHARAEARLPIECRGLPENDPVTMAAVNPWTARVICVALYDPDRRRGRVLYIGDRAVAPLGPAAFRFEGYADERALLTAFWATLERCPGVQLVGYNSRRFDGSVLFVRSFLLGVPCTANVLPHRYGTRWHLDLHDVLGGWGNTRTPSLDVVCRLAGIPSPKKGLDGSQVQAAWDAGRIFEIAAYCAADVLAEAEVAERWDATVGRVFPDRYRR